MIGLYIYFSGFFSCYLLMRRYQRKIHYKYRNVHFKQDWDDIGNRLTLAIFSWLTFIVLLLDEWKTLGFKTIKMPKINWPKIPTPPNWL